VCATYLRGKKISALRQPDRYGFLPLNYTAISRSKSIIGFRTVFEAGIYYFPKKKGVHLLFEEIRTDGETPFQYACVVFGYDEVMKVVEQTLNTNSDKIPFDTADALLPAIINEKIHLDCVYFLLRREPDVLQKLLISSLASPPSALATVMGSNNDGNDNDSDDDNSSSNICNNSSNINNNIGNNSGKIVDNGGGKNNDGGGSLLTENDAKIPKERKRKR
jgi:hypothetical protein